MKSVKEKAKDLTFKTVLNVIKNKKTNYVENKSRTKEELESFNNEAPPGFVFVKTKRIDKKKVQFQNIFSIVMFVISFILPTVMALNKRMHMDQSTTFEKYYFYIFVGLIVLDILIYLPIFFINMSLSRKNNYKKTLLVLLTLRKIEKLIMAGYSLSFIFYGLPKMDVILDLNGIIEVFKSNILMSVLSVLTAGMALFSSNKKLVNQVTSEIMKTNTKIEKYEYEKATGDVLVKVYKRVEKRSILKAMLSRVVMKIVSILFTIIVLVTMVLLLVKF